MGQESGQGKQAGVPRLVLTQGRLPMKGVSRTWSPPETLITTLPSSSLNSLSLSSAGSKGELCWSTTALMAGRSASVVTGQANRKYSGAGGAQPRLCFFQCPFWPAQGDMREEEGEDLLRCMLACTQGGHDGGHTQRRSTRLTCTPSTSSQCRPCRMRRRHDRSAQCMHGGS